MDPNRGAGTAHLFLAAGAQFVQEPTGDDLEEQQLVRLSIDQLREEDVPSSVELR